MAAIDSFVKRLDERVEKARAQVQQRQAVAQSEYTARKERYQKFLQVLNDLRDVARPRLDKLAEHCKFEATPVENADGKSVMLNFQTPVARIRLRLSATHDTEIRNLVLGYDLEILPVFLSYKQHDESMIPLDQVDRAKVETWLDDRLIEFAETYVTVHFNDQYHKDHMVMDPVANVRFPKAFAHSTVERDGTIHYFISEQTRREFEQRKK